MVRVIHRYFYGSHLCAGKVTECRTMRLSGSVIRNNECAHAVDMMLEFTVSIYKL